MLSKSSRWRGVIVVVATGVVGQRRRDEDYGEGSGIVEIWRGRRGSDEDLRAVGEICDIGS